MNGLWESVKQIYGLLALIPFIPFGIVYAIARLMHGDRKRAFRLAMDVTTALLIGIVSVLFNEIFGSSFGFYGILLAVLIAAGLLGNLQYRKKGRIDASRIGRAVWRLGFFALSLLYVLFMCIRIGQDLWSA